MLICSNNVLLINSLLDASLLSGISPQKREMQKLVSKTYSLIAETKNEAYTKNVFIKLHLKKI